MKDFEKELMQAISMMFETLEIETQIVSDEEGQQIIRTKLPVVNEEDGVLFETYISLIDDDSEGQSLAMVEIAGMMLINIDEENMTEVEKAVAFVNPKLSLGGFVTIREGGMLYIKYSFIAREAYPLELVVQMMADSYYICCENAEMGMKPFYDIATGKFSTQQSIEMELI